MVAPAPIAMRAPADRTCVKPLSVERTMLVTAASPSLTARITSVPPARKRASRSAESAAAASASVANVFTVIGMRVVPFQSGERGVTADRLEARLVDLRAHKLRHSRLLAPAGAEASFPAPEGAVAVGDRQQAH